MSAPASPPRQQGLPPEVVARSWTAQQRLCRRSPASRRPQVEPEHRRHCGRTRTRRVRVGRNDHRLNTMSAGRHDLGDVTPGSSATCRSTADADPIPVKLDMPNHPAVATGVVIRGNCLRIPELRSRLAYIIVAAHRTTLRHVAEPPRHEHPDHITGATRPGTATRPRANAHEQHPPRPRPRTPPNTSQHTLDIPLHIIGCPRLVWDES